jgi:hypothetical protein
MSFKFPIVLRFSIWLPIFFGMVHGVVTRNLKTMAKHLYTIPLYMAFFSQEEIYQLYCIKTGKPIVWRQRGQNVTQKSQTIDENKKKIDD